MAVGDVYSLVVKGKVHNQTTMNVFHYWCSITGDADDADDLVAAFRTNCETQYLACCASEFELEGYICQKIHPLPVLASFTQGVAFTVGTGGVESLPSSVAVVLTKRTSIGGKAGRGRVYMPAVPVDFEADSVLTGGALGTYTNLANKLDDPLTVANGGVYVPALWHRASRTHHSLIGVTPRNVLRNQRRRQVGRGI